jgi:hypothetical protein
MSGVDTNSIQKVFRNYKILIYGKYKNKDIS